MDRSIVESLLTWVEAHPALVNASGHLPVALDRMPSEGVEAVMLQSLAGDPVVRKYKAGGFVAAHPFAVRLRTAGADTAGRIDAINALGDMGASIDDRTTWPTPPEGFEYTSLSMRTSPARIAGDDAGAEDYQVTFELTYRKRG